MNPVGVLTWVGALLATVVAVGAVLGSYERSTPGPYEGPNAALGGLEPDAQAGGERRD